VTLLTAATETACHFTASAGDTSSREQTSTCPAR